MGKQRDKPISFLNPLNDLGSSSIAAHDVLTTPSIVVKPGEGMHFQGFYNQLKQEYASARGLYYEGTTSTTPHFSDKGVLLINTLDYPCYSLAIEKVKMAFRMAYSLLDKMAYFLNDYLALGIPERKVNFRSFWYDKQERKRGLLPGFESCDNWPLRGLFWLSKDLFEDAPEFREGREHAARPRRFIVAARTDHGGFLPFVLQCSTPQKTGQSHS